VEKEAAYMRMAVCMDRCIVFAFESLDNFAHTLMSYRRIDSITGIPALSLPPRDSPMWQHACFYPDSPRSCKSQSWGWSIPIHMVSKF
jgi:hypothetical protein